MGIDLVALRTEISSDPQGLGYKPLMDQGSDGGVATLLNTINPSIVVSQGVLAKDTFMMSLQRGLADILGRADTDTVKTAFRGWLALMQLANSINTTDAAVIATLNSAVAAGVFTQAEVNAAIQRPGSRAEQLWGTGTVVTADDVAHAFGRI